MEKADLLLPCHFQKTALPFVAKTFFGGKREKRKKRKRENVNILKSNIRNGKCY